MPSDVNSPDIQLRIFNRQVRVRCDDDLLRQLVLANYAAFEEPAESADIVYTACRNGGSGFSIARNDETVVEESSDDAIRYEFMYLLEKLITLDLQELRTDLYFVHSSALERDGRVIMIPADSGTGKWQPSSIG